MLYFHNESVYFLCFKLIFILVQLHVKTFKQVEKRAFDIFGDDETIEKMKEEREENQLKRKKKAFDKKVKGMSGNNFLFLNILIIFH